MGAMLFAEKTGLNFLVDFDRAQAETGFGAWVRTGQHVGLRFLVTFAMAMGVLAWVRSDERVTALDAEIRAEPFRLRWFVAHCMLVGGVAGVTFLLYRPTGPAAPYPLLVGMGLALATAGALALFASAAPWSLWKRLGGALGVLWLYAGILAALAAALMQWSQSLWHGAASLTFNGVDLVLAPLIPGLQIDTRNLIFDTGRFAIQVADVCSGLEGAGLMLAFCCVWLVLFRKEYLFPQALILVPVALASSLVLNIFRIAALVVIGNAGYQRVAIYGFHSQAGWIAFNAAAIGIAFVSRQSAWLNRAARSQATTAAHDLKAVHDPATVHNPTAAYLLPLLAILAAGVVSAALSDGFEYLYGLRLLAGGVAVVYCWPRWTRLDWHFGWRGLGTGLIVFGLWMGSGALLLRPEAMPDALVAMSPTTRALWIVGRIVGSVLLVPIAEELAYRGFLLRRLVASDFERVRFESVGLIPLLVSSLAFGLTHGAMWMPAIVAGLAYGWVLVRTGRMGEAVVAHGVTNALICFCVCYWGRWELW
jgi:exosortase E/protease (VPEID-CTERM system)